jgi:hypothetical protein
MVHGIDSAHRSLASLFFDDVRNESRRARDHEYPVERRGIQSKIGRDGPIAPPTLMGSDFFAPAILADATGAAPVLDAAAVWA